MLHSSARKMQDFVNSKGIACSRTTSYNHEGNGRVERFNGIIWKAITLTLKSRGPPAEYWQSPLADALHSIRSLSTATNATPLERLLNSACRSSAGALCHPGYVNQDQYSYNGMFAILKNDPLVDEVELLQANPNYAHIKYPNERETTV
ncbi:uncharacterized protein [Palaemon carinicauda]|uniref:uncharacterized protein n=1 Tax=Palaemon carinicauda TaxID=392227 RepID=UPI0035B64629